MIQTKICNTCNQEKTLEWYNVRDSKTGQLRASCITCDKGALYPRKLKRAEKLALFEKGFKVCHGCKETLPIDNFTKHTDPRSVVKLMSSCKECMRKRSHTPRVQRMIKTAILKAKYGLTLQEYNDILNQQNNKCPLCGVDYVMNRKNSASPNVDHNHKTGKVRGIICGGCNRAIGLIKDRPEVAVNISTYLAKDR